MMIRRIFAGFLIFLFTLLSLPAFFTYGLSKTLFRPTFYLGEVKNGMYEFLMDTLSINFYKSDATLQRYFKQDEASKALRDVFTVDLFGTFMEDILSHTAELKKGEQMTLSLKLLQKSLFTAGQNLAADFFQTLPTCKDLELPQVNEEGIPTCIPKDLDYMNVSGPLAKQFERSVSNFFPEQLEINFSSDQKENILTLLNMVEKSKIYLLTGMLLLTVFIVILIHRPLSLMLQYEGFAFLISGFLGLLASLSFRFIPGLLLENYQSNAAFILEKNRLHQLLETLFSFPEREVQKIALIFVVLGGTLLLINLFLKRQLVLKNERP
jgi:hypothetical protein